MNSPDRSHLAPRLTPESSPKYRLGIDLGGTKIEIIALDTQGQTQLRTRVPTPKDDYTAIVKVIVDLVSTAKSQLSSTDVSLGIGIPGAISNKTGRIKNANTTALIGQALDADLTRALGIPVTLENDANCFALSEAIDGAAQHANTVFGVILGTGVGGGLVVNRQLIHGPNAIAGEWGHNPLPWPEQHDEPKQKCYCGKYGCIETYLSGPGMAQQANLQYQLNHTSHELMLPSKAQLKIEEKEPLNQNYHRYVDRLARSLATVINIFDPHTIVLGGGLSNVDSLYEDVPKVWGKYVFSDQVDTQLVKNSHGDSSGVRGAAWL